jgi:hypothetical protein
MSLELDVQLQARPKYESSISNDVTLDAALGTTHGGATLDVDVDISGDLSGGIPTQIGTATATDVGRTVTAAGMRVRVNSVQSSYGWDFDSSPYGILPFYIVHRIALADYDTDYDPPARTYHLQVPISPAVTVNAIPQLVIPDPPAPAPPAPPEDPGNFPMPTAGGLSLRVVHGVVLDMDTPTITDGIPHS